MSDCPGEQHYKEASIRLAAMTGGREPLLLAHHYALKKKTYERSWNRMRPSFTGIRPKIYSAAVWMR